MSGAVYLFGDVMVGILKSIFHKVTFFESEADSIFEKSFTDALKINEYYVRVATEENNVINNGAAVVHKLSFIEVKHFCLGD